jgi:hypothetical protein
MSKPVKLHLGCQEKYLEGYVNIDLPPSSHTAQKVKADVYSDVRDLVYENESVDEVRSHHMLEHFSRQEALVLLARWHKWLTMGGTIHMETPDFEESARKFVTTADMQEQFQLARHIFGSHEADWAYHKDFWSEDKYRFVLRELGYGDFVFEHFSNNLQQKVPKLRDSFIGKQEGMLKHLGKFGFNTLPNIVCYAKKTIREVDYEKAIEKILRMSLVGREQKILDVWMSEVRGKI